MNCRLLLPLSLPSIGPLLGNRLQQRRPVGIHLLELDFFLNGISYEPIFLSAPPSGSKSGELCC